MRALAACAAVALAACAGAVDPPPPAPPPSDEPLGPAGDFDRTITVDGATREYVLLVPESAVAAMAQAPVPQLVVLHGYGDEARRFVRAAQLDALAASRAFMLVAPRAPDGFAGQGARQEVDADVELVLAAADDARAGYRVDPARRYLAGFSRGGGFTALIATASENATARPFGVPPYTSPFAAYAVSAGNDMFQGRADLSLAAPKRPVWIIHGTADGAVPVAEGRVLDGRLRAAGWPGVRFSEVPDAPHDWLWRARFGHDNDELWTWLIENGGP